MKVLRTVSCLLLLSVSIPAQTVYIEGDTLFTKKSGQEVQVLQMLDVGRYESYSIRFTADTVTIRKISSGDSASSMLLKQYQLAGVLDKKLLNPYPSILADIAAELTLFKKELASNYGESDIWVDFQIFKYRSLGGVKYFIIRFLDGDRSYGGILYYMTSDRTFSKTALTSSRLDSMMGCELITGKTYVLFIGVDELTQVERKYLPK